MTKVAIIDPLGGHGSSHHFYLYGQADGLVENKISVSLYTNNKTNFKLPIKFKKYHFYQNIFDGNSRIISGIRWIIGSLFSIFHARLNNIKIFHFHIFYMNILVLFNILLTKILFGKIVLTIHDVDSFARKNPSFIENFIYKVTNIIVTHNEFSKSEILKREAYLKNIVHVIPHGNYLPFITTINNKQRSRLRLGIKNNHKVLLFFGMIKKNKGLDDLLEAFNILLKDYPNTILLITGRAWKNDFTLYEDIIKKYEIKKNCILNIRFIEDEEVRYFYDACDLVVLPYKTIYQSGVLMMALSYKKAVIAPDLPPIKEIITDGVDGYLFKNNSYIDLAKKLKTIFSEDKMIEKVANNGYDLMKVNYNWKNIGLQTKKCYDKIEFK